MSVKVMAMVWSDGPQNLKARLVLLAIADHADNAGCAYPGIELLAHKTRMDERSVMRWLKHLEAEGWMSIDRKSHGTGRKGNTYYLNLLKLGGQMNNESGPKSVDGGDLPGERHQLAQVCHVTERSAQVTKPQFSGDKAHSYMRSNHQEPSNKPSGRAEPRVVGQVGTAPNTSELMGLASEMLERLAVVAPWKTRRLAAEAIRLLSKTEMRTLKDAAKVVEERAKVALECGETVNAFWFEDGKWRERKATPASIGVYRPGPSVVPKVAERASQDQSSLSPDELLQGQTLWTSMKDAMKKTLSVDSFTIWVRPINAAGLVRGVLQLELPSDFFIGVEDRFDFRKFMAPELLLRCSVAEPNAA